MRKIFAGRGGILNSIKIFDSKIQGKLSHFKGGLGIFRELAYYSLKI